MCCGSLAEAECVEWKKMLAKIANVFGVHTVGEVRKITLSTVEGTERCWLKLELILHLELTFPGVHPRKN